MHLIVATRGLRDEVRKWIEKLSAINMPFKVGKADPEGKIHGINLEGNLVIPLRICPVQLWDFSFPEECQDAMLNTLIGRRDTTGTIAPPINPSNKKWVNLLRMGLKLEKIPKFDKTLKFPVEDPMGTEVVAIGIKKDGRFEDGTERI